MDAPPSAVIVPVPEIVPAVTYTLPPAPPANVALLAFALIDPFIVSAPVIVSFIAPPPSDPFAESGPPLPIVIGAVIDPYVVELGPSVLPLSPPLPP